MNELIIIKQLPIIEEKLKEIKNEIELKLKKVDSLIVSEDTVKDVKKIRAEFNNEFKELENQRTTIKKQVLAPYEAFELVYKDCVSEPYKNADSKLKNKIDEVESNLKLEKENEIKEYFYELREAEHLVWLPYEKANINVTLSASMKSLKEEAKAFIDRVVSDLNVIDTQENKIEILVLFKETLDLNNAIMIVKNRKEREARELESQSQVQEIKEVEAEKIQVVETLTAPKEDEQVYSMTFTVQGTKTQLKDLKNYLVERGLLKNE